ncbi:hypothetical protein Ahy_B03g063142 [Arachis hypogaea]|uniref:Protein FAR1-RELATED SEQUENCE n=1 Tax=Arachis hypogaea TaxID=3818 RepID=A0A444ZWS9_ARAHY|nr:hypothetical protein Ahy_B03g063142 [Arachis hypogaea]
MTFKMLEDATKFYKDYSKAIDFSTRVRSTNKKERENENRKYLRPRRQISQLNIGVWIISKVVLNHSHSCCPNQVEMLKQYRELSMFVRRTIKNNEEAGIRPSKTYQSFVAAARGHRELNFIEKDVRNYITREVRNGAKRERESDAADFHTIIPCATKSSIEAQFQHVYNHDKKVQAQFREKVNCITRSKHSALGYSVYEVVEQVSNSTFNKFAVTYDTSRGILCHHALSVLSFERVNKVSPRYILERWSKNVKRRHTHIKSSHDEPLLELRSKRFDELNICEFASESEKLTAIMHCAYDNDMVEMQEQKSKSNKKYSLSHEDANFEAINELQSPPHVRTRRRPKNRLGSKMENHIANASKKKKMKALSELNL